MKENLLTALNITCYIITATVLIFVLWVFTGPEDTSPAGIEYHECIETAKTIAPDNDTRWLIQKGCMGNYLIHAQ